VSPVASGPSEQGVRELFNGKDLTGWKVTNFGGEGTVRVRDGIIRLEMGEMLTGITWEGDGPREDYELTIEARRVNGNDFFCGVTFPVGDEYCSFIVGGWGGGLVGISSIDGLDASENETTQVRSFERGRWYRIRIAVSKLEIGAWIDDQPMAKVAREGRRFDVRPEVLLSIPLGIAAYQTTAEVRRIELRQTPVKKHLPIVIRDWPKRSRRQRS